MSELIQLENKFYISVNSTYADDRVKVLNHIDTFGIFDRWGDIKQLGEEVQGIYHNGTRFISNFELRINDRRPLLLSSAVKEENKILSVDLTNPALHSADKHIPKDALYIGRSKFLRLGSCFEQIRIINYDNEPYEFDLSLAFDADFKDIFEVRGMKRERRGEITEIRHVSDNKVRICYKGLDQVDRITEVCLSQPPDDWQQHNKAIYKMKLAPHEEYVIEYALRFLREGEKTKGVGFSEAQQEIQDDREATSALLGKISTSNELFNEWINRSQNDLSSLLANTEYGRYPYAGVPWYNTAFGRDGIITALETLWLAPDIARQVLQYLARTQATEVNPYQDAEPGKIIHEVRGGEMAALNEIPFSRYYGSVDATPLFIMLAGAYYHRTNDIRLIKQLWPNINAAMDWIDQYGDVDGDGFVEYQHKSINGLTNQGWKDSQDSIMHENGDLVQPPVALCEVQAYVYDARIQAAILAIECGEPSLAKKWEQQAATLKKQFNQQFWDEELSCYVLALDGDKKPCRVVSSNAGHCLFAAIAHEDKAQKLVSRLLQPDMFSGWGVRTLSKKEKRFNPMSYHNGSIWPHDVALIARGFSKYGYMDEALKLTSALYDASLFIELQRLPELFCGFDRRKGEGPTSYPVACSPQAWSVAAVFMLLESCLRMEINAKTKKIHFYGPVMPEGIDFLEIKGLKLDNDYADLTLYMDRQSIGVKITACPSPWQVSLVTGP